MLFFQKAGAAIRTIWTLVSPNAVETANGARHYRRFNSPGHRWSGDQSGGRTIRLGAGPVFIGFAAHAEIQFTAGENIGIGKPGAG